ncbi:hypothetical protein A1O1_07950 [Capronia coronata CBS 617.96]|uniref:Galactosyl transferase GMA12/MNN10 family protein n=1 Tax=Capronia coronata CBS 617.96 TaxID=1182541 RepID=W9XX21_9EURO|nr:uncharacterized protein A1O1_07950 [Capronia coronata CBS 617.96]EXJ81885.1 hypothetical protein A1O1_07950 [Capronia coronata CBS 617.96]
MAYKEWSPNGGRRPSYRMWVIVAIAFIVLFFITPLDKIRTLRPGSESIKQLESYSYKLPDEMHPAGPNGGEQPRIGLVSMAYGDDTSVYDRAIQSHARHAARHNYPLFVLRREIAEGYWSKTLYLISLLIQELSKPEDQRLEWLMWFDADSVAINREIPLEVFLPDKADATFDDTNVVIAHDKWGMNTGIFFTRVHPRSVTILTKAFGYPIWKPDEDLKHAYDQRALDLTLCSAEFQRNVLWVPRPFFNARHEEVVPGTMFVHFYSDVKRPEHMLEWLEKSETGQDADMQIAYNDSYYPPQVEEFWNAARECHNLVKVGQESIKAVQDESLKKVLQENWDRLDNACIWKTEDVPALKGIIEEVKLATQWT